MGYSPCSCKESDMTEQLSLWASQVVLVVKNPPAMQEIEEILAQSLGWKDPLEEGMATCSSTLAWRRTHGQRSLVGYSPWGWQRVRYN